MSENTEVKHEPVHFDVVGSTATAPTIQPTITESTPVESAEQQPLPQIQGAQCHICSTAFKHCEVVMMGLNKAKTPIAIHPSCLKEGVDVEELTNINVAIDTGKKVSSAKEFVVRKHIKALLKKIQKAQMAQQQKGN